ncbi:helix-turn-helix domain-containing protein [Micromonospora sp. LH3U1]|uniref:helix-turn-helix domain-containing protein n=1 Tax=Micromonospora sp. LH3U1 TaxID=3018339 RepID=UPI00234A55A2|nr:helix-turn-helix domain-containing protein [Micromonospora sp. LH3U1]WCN80247.1 helix-turn-helix domain-containing protein [Micromonospora sp. LH3U1]
MTGPGRRNDNEPPIGRRMAELRMRRGMSQQVFADRIRKSKSWVDKVERGVRTLDRLSVIETVAAALGVAPDVLLAGKVAREPVTDTGGDVERVRAALARHDIPGSGNDGRPASSLAQLDDQAGYAWAAYRHGHHPRVLRLLPDLLDASRQVCHTQTGNACAAALLVRVYRLAAQVLVKVGEADLAWLAADRAMSAAAGDPWRAGLATISLAQALRALCQGRLAMTAAVTAVHQLDLAPSQVSRPDGTVLTGTLLIEAALAAAVSGDASAAGELTERVAHLACADGERHHDGTAFGPTPVDLARALVAMWIGDHQLAVVIHQRATSGNAWHLLPAEYRAAHLIDVTRAHLDLGDPHAAGRALVAADRIAPMETRIRPASRAALTAVLRAGPTAADVARLAATMGLSAASR